MENLRTLRPPSFLVFVALLCFVSVACQRKASVSGNSSPSADQALPSANNLVPTGPVEPATVGQEAGSISTFIHFPKESPAAGMDSAVQFYCDVASDGSVATTYAVIGEQDEFKKAVQSALDWGHFKPARVNGKPSPVYLGGTVLFMHQDGRPVIVISLATADRERIGKLGNYVQPQLVGGLRGRLETAEMNASIDLPNEGASEVLAKISENGELTSTSTISEIPNGIGLADFLIGAIKDARFTPAYVDGKPTAGDVNIVANFAEF